MGTTIHACVGTILVGGSGEQRHNYCDRCRAFAYGDDADVPTGTDKQANREAWDAGEQRSPGASYVIQCRHTNGSTPWAREPATGEYESVEAAEAVIATLETEDEDGAALEYRVQEG